MAYWYPQSRFTEPAPPPINHYRIQGKAFSVRDNFKIIDQQGYDAFIVKSKVLSIGDKMVLQDKNGHKLLKIRQEVLNLMPTFEITSSQLGESSRRLAHIKQDFTLFCKKFTIESVFGPYELEAVDLLAHSFKISKGGRQVATVKKEYFSSADNYAVDIAADENQAFILALIIIVNQVLYTFHWQKLTILR